MEGKGTVYRLDFICQFWVTVLQSTYETKRRGVGLMSDDNEKEPDNKKEPLQNNFYVRVGFVVICLLVIYYIFSPYQNCKRDGGFNESGCIQYTSW